MSDIDFKVTKALMNAREVLEIAQKEQLEQALILEHPEIGTVSQNTE